MSFSFSAALNNLVGNTPGANVSNLVQCLNDLKNYINGSIDSTNLLDGGVTEAKLAAAARVPAGTILMTGAAVADTGYLLCDGAAVSRATYAALFTAIGTAFGAGNGTTTFNLPDLRGRSPLGAGTGSGLTARTLGTKYGQQGIMAHSHGIGSSNFDRPAINSAGAEGNIGTGGLVAVVSATAVEGSGTDNLHPTQTVNYQIKTG